jgi:hypothetical protein
VNIDTTFSLDTTAWEACDVSTRQSIFDAVCKETERKIGEFTAIAEGYYNNAAVSEKRKNYLKIILTIFSLLISILNIFAASHNEIVALPIASAIVAAVLAAIINIDSYFDFSRRNRDERAIYENLRDLLNTAEAELANLRALQGPTHGAYQQAVKLLRDFTSGTNEARRVNAGKPQEPQPSSGAAGDGGTAA